jgi:hypothetical protein
MKLWFADGHSSGAETLLPWLGCCRRAMGTLFQKNLKMQTDPF